MSGVFDDFDFSDFWENTPYILDQYVGAPLTDDMVKSVERITGFKLPDSYIELLRIQNGGRPRNTCHPMASPSSHVSLSGIYGLDPKKHNSLARMNEFYVSEWQYPRIGVYCCDCPSAGHDMLCLDYRKCRAQDEPSVVHIDQEGGYEIELVAENFESFIRGLTSSDVFAEEI